MGLLDLLTGRRAAPASTPRRSEAVLLSALLDLNRDSSPVVIRDGAVEGCDLVAEWRIAEARWFEIFAKAGLTKAARLLLRLDTERGEVRAVQQDWTVEWRAGVPTASLSAEAFRGQKVEISWGRAHAFREEDLRWGKVYDWTFDTRALKGPVKATVAASGWAWRPVAFGRL